MCQLTNNLYETNRRDSFDFCYLLSIPHLMERSVNIHIVVSVIYFDALSAMMMMNIKREQ